MDEGYLMFAAVSKGVEPDYMYDLEPALPEVAKVSYRCLDEKI